MFFKYAKSSKPWKKKIKDSRQPSICAIMFQQYHDDCASRRYCGWEIREATRPSASPHSVGASKLECNLNGYVILGIHMDHRAGGTLSVTWPLPSTAQYRYGSTVHEFASFQCFIKRREKVIMLTKCKQTLCLAFSAYMYHHI